MSEELTEAPSTSPAKTIFQGVATLLVTVTVSSVVSALVEKSMDKAFERRNQIED